MDICLGATLIICMVITYTLMILGYIGIQVAFILLFLSFFISIMILFGPGRDDLYRHDQ